MKNLLLLTERIGTVPLHDVPHIPLHTADSFPSPTTPQWRATSPFIQASALNSPARVLYFVTSSNVLFAYHLDTAIVLLTLPLSTPPSTGSSSEDAHIPSSDSVISLHYIAETECLHIATSHGSLLSLHAHSLLLTTIGHLPRGLLACALSPDRELLVLVTSDYRVLLMTPDGDVVAEAAIAERGEGVLPGQLMPRTADLPDGGTASVSWRGDGQYFAVSTFHPAYDFRRVRVFSRQCEQSAQSFPFPSQRSTAELGLSPLLSWRPSGNLLTSTERRRIGRTVKHEVVFFERNGLRHGEFLLRQVEEDGGPVVKREEKSEPRKARKRKEEDDEDETVDDAFDESERFAPSSAAVDVDVLDAVWNADSDVLALLVHRAASKQQSVQLWAMSNYVYQLKHEVCLRASASPGALSMIWDPESALHLVVVGDDGRVHSMLFDWDVDVSLTERRWAAVVDGFTVKLTPLARTIIPPPMSFASITFPSNVTAVAFPAASAASGSGSPMCALCADSSVHVVHDLDALPRRLLQPLASLSHLSFSLLSLPYPVEHFRLPLLVQTAGGLTLIGVNAFVGAETLDEIVEIKLTTEAGDVGDDMYRTPASIGCHVLRLSQNARHGCAYVQLQSGAVHRYSPASESSAPSLSPFSSFPSPCPHFAVVDMAGTAVTVGRDRRSRLYCDATLLTPVCSSFSLHHPSFLAFTIGGQQNALFFVSLHRPLAHALSPEARSDPHSLRLVEKGSHLLTLIPSTQMPRAVLQMPRGNLEAVYPRALTLDSLNRALSQGRWREAYVTARVNRVDLNLLYDHDPQDWWEDAEAFVREVRDVDWLNLFMSDMEDRDVRTEDFPNYTPLPSERGVQRRKARGGEPSGGAGGDRGEGDEDDHDRLRAGLTAADDGLKRGQRLYKDRRAREQAAAELEARLTAASSASAPSFASVAASTSKVNLICDHLRSVFLRVDPSFYTHCIITSYVRKSPPELEHALTVIKQLRDASPAPAAAGQSTPADSALKYAIFLCDVQALYDVALGMYDEGLTLLVAQHARMDPAEYVPFVQGLMREKRGPRYREYRVDRHLKRWEKSAAGLIKAVEGGEVRGEDEWPEVLRLIKEHRLWDAALRLTTPNELDEPTEGTTDGRRRREERERCGAPDYDFSSRIDRFRALQQAYGAHLRENKQAAQAAAAFLLAHDYDQALLAYRDGGEWRLGLALAHSLSLTHTAVCELVMSFIAVLRSRPHGARDAAFLTIHYLEDVEEAVALLLQAEDWEEALRVCWMHHRPDLLPQVVEPDMRQGLARMERELARRLDKYQQAVGRLRVVRRAKLMYSEERAEREGGGLGDRDVENDDLLSIVSGVAEPSAGLSSASSVSGLSAITGLTSASASSSSSLFSLPSASAAPMTADERRLAKHADRLRRKQSKRRVKQGSAGEEAALVDLIRDVRVNDRLRQRLASALRAWMQHGWRDDAARVQRRWKELEAVTQREEAREMPMLEGMTEAQRAQLSRHWDWPGGVQRNAKDRDEHAPDALGTLFVLDHVEAAEHHVAANGIDETEDAAD